MGVGDLCEWCKECRVYDISIDEDHKSNSNSKNSKRGHLLLLTEGQPNYHTKKQSTQDEELRWIGKNLLKARNPPLWNCATPIPEHAKQTVAPRRALVPGAGGTDTVHSSTPVEELAQQNLGKMGRPN